MKRMIPILAVLVAIPLGGQHLHGQVVLDGSLGRAGPVQGPAFSIPESDGRRAGANLFHSFSQFDVKTGESATFSGAPDIQRVLVRVTGGSKSMIDGRIATQGMPSAGLVFINPSGILLGANAQFSIAGSIALSTADVVHLADGGRFDARLPQPSLLTTAPVEAFGFIGPAAAAIEISGAKLSTAGRPVTLVGGDVTVTGAEIRSHGGDIHIISRHGEGTVNIGSTDAPGSVTINGGTGGAVQLKGKTVVESSLANGGSGRIVIRGGQILVTGESDVLSTTQSDQTGGSIDVVAEGTLTLENNSKFRSTSSGPGRGGDIDVRADVIDINNLGILRSDSHSTGHGGDIRVQTRALAVDGGFNFYDTGLFSQATFSSSGGGGDIFVAADVIAMHRGGRFLSNAGGDGHGGAITVRTCRLSLTGAGYISSQVNAAGDAGRIDIDAQTINLDGFADLIQADLGEEHPAFSGILADSRFGAGRTADVVIAADALDIRNQAIVSATTNSGGLPGSVTITAGRITIDGLGAAGFTGIASNAQDAASPVPAGGIIIRADELNLLRRGRITTVSFGGGNAGNIDLSVGLLDLRSDSRVSAAASNADGGNIYIDAQQVRSNRSTITAAAGLDGASITIDAPLVILQRSTINGLSGLALPDGDPLNARPVEVRIPLNAALFRSDTDILSAAIEVPSPLDLSGQLLDLSAHVLSAEDQLLDRCETIYRRARRSTFFVRRVSGQPLEAGGWLPGLREVGPLYGE